MLYYIQEKQRRLNIVNINETALSNYDQYAFGNYIRSRREELGISCRKLAKLMGVSVQYLSDVELGKRSAPTELTKGKDRMKDFIKHLNITSQEISSFYEMADATRNSFPDIDSYLKETPLAKNAIRLAQEINLPSEEWEKIIRQMLKYQSTT